MTVSDCWCNDLSVAEAMEKTGESMEVVVAEYNLFEYKMKLYFSQRINTIKPKERRL